jgi:hypothetical protein
MHGFHFGNGAGLVLILILVVVFFAAIAGSNSK